MIESTVKVKAKVHVRWGIRMDMPSMLAIDAATHRVPWYDADFVGRLRERNTIGMTAERDGRVVGYVVYKLRSDRIEMIRLGVDPEFGGMGVGAQIVAKIKSKLHPGRRSRIVVEMRETNLDGLLFLKRMGFRSVGMTRRWFDDTDEDMIQMEYDVSTDARDGE